ncbi:hypothetical protein FHR83_004544 [Actinoplanes campanulatus]|uniref:Uncharacterized protein n=1 Tax=Actinoplanes campanulatus TaxID=113559 RepID=A0A7W5AIR5_9ACTN|nr:hypothetical protein [Actinoplanes campanulatus]MBB3096870.1 hypothetical protein [Actinoplanes campanulatus]GGN44641.1 hypothetical protein GCM10010109_78030 [Actinoplanes campanulatus]GID37414.1 hypothetical protein Aca09nite_39200 [Actinoplanes campanulatus]
MRLTEMSGTCYRTSISVLGRPGGGIRWVLIPTIHMGHADYYWEIWQRLRTCQAVIAEQYDGPSSTGLAYITAMRWTGQRVARQLVHQDIDYGALDVPIIFPDAHLGPEARPDRRLPRETWAGLAVMTPVLAIQMALTGSGLVEGMTSLELTDESRPRFADDYLTRIILTERDDLLLGAIGEIDGEFAAEDMEVAVVFGALHIPVVVRELRRIGHRVEPGTRWLTAIDFDEPPYLRKPSLDGWMDW